MPPRWAIHTLGLCNVVAGALVALVPSVFMPGADGIDTISSRLLGASLGVVLVAVGAGAWLLPSTAVGVYLWLFGVGVKVVAAALWGWAARQSGVGMLWVGAALDLAVALAIAGGLLRRR
jgi:hypothetical protein